MKKFHSHLAYYNSLKLDACVKFETIHSCLRIKMYIQFIL